MMTTSGNARIVKRKINDDVSFAFSVVRHVRIMGRSNNLPLAKIMTVRQSEFGTRAEEFWREADKVLDELETSGKVWHQCRLKIERKFAAVLPRPAAVATKSVEPSLESNYDVMQKLIREVGEKAERKLRERGINL